MSESRPLAEQGHKIRSISFSNKKANTSEANELIQRIHEVKLFLN